MVVTKPSLPHFEAVEPGLGPSHQRVLVDRDFLPNCRIVPRSRGHFRIERDRRRQRNGCSTLISHISIRRGFGRFRSCERGCKETYAANRIARSVRRNSARSCPVFPNRARTDELFFSPALIRSVPFLSDLSGRTFRSKSDGCGGYEECHHE